MEHRENIIPHNHDISQKDRVRSYGFKPQLIWFTGLSGSGKSTLASTLEAHFFSTGVHTYILDGDNVRSGLNSDLDFSDASRKENIRRIAEVARLFVDAGIVTITAFISPFEEERAFAKSLVGEDQFIEVFVDCPLEICEQRDVKGLYAKARAGLIKDFTGISSPFEIPKAPDVTVNTAENSLESCLKELIDKIEPQVLHV